jgi:uncharacterized protein
MFENQAFFAGVLRYRWWIIIATFVYTLVTFNGLDGLVKRSDYKAFMDPEYPGMIELDEVESIFNENNNLFIVITPADSSVFSTASLSVIRDLTERSWSIPYALRVDSITNYQHTEAVEDSLFVDYLVPNDQEITKALAERARDVAMAESSLSGLLVSKKQDVAAIKVTFQFQDGDILSREQAEVSGAIGVLLNEFRQVHPEIDFKVAGSVTIDYAADEYTARVSSVQLPLMLGVMTILLLILLRSFWATVCTAIVVILTGATTLGMIGYFRMEIDGVTSMSPIIIMTLAVADSVHVITGMQDAMRDGLTKAKAILYSLKLNYTPVFLTSLTTVLGIITFTFSPFPSLKKLGLIIALGVIVAFVLSITLLPALLSLLPMKATEPGTHGKGQHGILKSYTEFVIRYHKSILIVSTLVCIACGSMLSKISINESFETLFGESTPEKQAINHMEEHLSGALSMDVAIFSETPEGLNDPEFLATVDRFQLWLSQQAGVNHVVSVTDTFKRLNKNMHGDDPDWDKLPEAQDLAAQYLLLYEMSLPYGFDLQNQIDIYKSATRLTLMMSGLNSGQIVALDRSIENWFAQEAPHLKVIPTGVIPLMSELTYLHMIPSMMKGGIIAVIMVSLVLFFALRNWRLGVLGMLANIVPILIGYSLWGATKGMVNFPVISVAGICLGVVVDFVVHFLSKYRQGLGQGETVETAIRYAFDKVGKPLLVTMIVLVSGFWVLASTPYSMIGNLGLLTGVIILLAFVFDMLVLPAILLTFNKQFGIK